MATQSRYIRRCEWMNEHRITYVAIGEQLGISATAVSRMLYSETMPVKRHQQMLALGFPDDMLPVPFDRPRGRPKNVPIFPGLAASESRHADA